MGRGSSAVHKLPQNLQRQRALEPRAVLPVVSVGQRVIVGSGLIEELLALGDLGLEILQFIIHRTLKESAIALRLK